MLRLWLGETNAWGPPSPTRRASLRTSCEPSPSRRCCAIVARPDAGCDPHSRAASCHGLSAPLNRRPARALRRPSQHCQILGWRYACSNVEFTTRRRPCSVGCSRWHCPSSTRAATRTPHVRSPSFRRHSSARLLISHAPSSSLMDVALSQTQRAADSKCPPKSLPPRLRNLDLGPRRAVRLVPERPLDVRKTRHCHIAKQRSSDPVDVHDSRLMDPRWTIGKRVGEVHVEEAPTQLSRGAGHASGVTKLLEHAPIAQQFAVLGKARRDVRRFRLELTLRHPRSTGTPLISFARTHNRRPRHACRRRRPRAASKPA